MLSVEETLKFYALIKGIKTAKIIPVIEKAIKDLNLKDHRHKMAGTLSGGNKRKLSVAMDVVVFQDSSSMTPLFLMVADTMIRHYALQV